ncbi:MAG: hypothetical protein VKK94_01255, partial [Cyanobacteriota bacterium]|nr:hypothetical protein [Cyanobacteriota bacterium]
PGGRQVREAAIEAGAWGCVISGAGPSLLALCSSETAELVSKTMVRAWHKAGVESRSEVLSIEEKGSHWARLPDHSEPAGQDATSAPNPT